jgi:RND family efflux transporter MFP subunit
MIIHCLSWTRTRICKTAILSLLALLATAGSSSAQRPAAVVRVDEVRTEPLSQTVPVIGRLVARHEGVVAARVGGAIANFNVRVGDRVKTGDVIASIEDALLIAARQQAQARLAETQARIGTARAQLALARQETTRLAALKNTQATSKALYDDALQSEAIGRARVREAQAAMNTARANLVVTEIDLQHAQVTAPYTGIIVQRILEKGAYAKTGDAMVRMMTDTEMEVEADVPFEQLAGLVVGLEVQVALDDGKRYTAVVRAIIPEEDRRTRTRAVRLSSAFANAKTLADGQSATLQVPIGAARTVTSVHKDAVNRRGDKTLVYVVQSEIAKLRPVTLGLALGTRFEVINGLQAGEVVVVRGNERLRPDDKVRIDSAGKPAS